MLSARLSWGGRKAGLPCQYLAAIDGTRQRAGIVDISALFSHLPCMFIATYYYNKDIFYGLKLAFTFSTGEVTMKHEINISLIAFSLAACRT